MIRNVAEYPVEVIMGKVGDSVKSLIPEYQRLYVWKADRKSKFIRHILSGYPTHKVFIDDRRDSWKILDGQQRITTLFDFINDDFSLDRSGMYSDADKWNGKKFSQLDNKDQREILRYTLTCEIITAAENQEIEGLFDGLNSGMPLGKITEILLKDIEVKSVLNKMKSFPFIKDIIKNMSETEISKQEDDLLTLRVLAMFSKDSAIGIDGDTLEAILVDKSMNKNLEDVLKRIAEICLSIESLYTEETFGFRKLIPPHSIPIFMWYKTKVHNTERFKCFAEALTSNEDFKDRFKTMNRSNTAAKTKQEQRLQLFNEIYNSL